MRPHRPGTSLFFTALNFIAALSLAVAAGSPAYAKEGRKNLPPRAVSVSPEYTGIVAEKGENINLDLKVANGGRQDEDIHLKIDPVPSGWKAWIKTYDFQVTGVHVESDSTKSLDIRAEPGPDVGPGEYTFGIKARTRDGRLTSKSRLVVTVIKAKKEKKPGGVNIVTSYPVLRGPTDSTFEFSLEVDSKIDKDTIFNLSAQGPKDWDINFKPAYEDKLISSLRLKANQSETVAVEVEPHGNAKPGEYPIKVNVDSPEAGAEAKLRVVLTGTYKLNMGTADGLLSLNAVKGEEANLSFYVKNSGSATLKNVSFLSVKPENWKVEFIPEEIPSIPQGKLEQVEVSITPAEQALVGDYSVVLRTEAGKVSDAIELRVTVNASTAWGWIGIGIIVLVIAGLVSLFIRFGRR